MRLDGGDAADTAIDEAKLAGLFSEVNALRRTASSSISTSMGPRRSLDALTQATEEGRSNTASPRSRARPSQREESRNESWASHPQPVEDEKARPDSTEPRSPSLRGEHVVVAAKAPGELGGGGESAPTRVFSFSLAAAAPAATDPEQQAAGDDEAKREAVPLPGASQEE